MLILAGLKQGRLMRRMDECSRFMIRGAMARPFTVLLAFVIAQTCSVAALAGQSVQHAASPEEVVRQFYDWYLHAGMPNPERKNLATFRKYVTQRLLKKQMDPEVDADLFLNAQDFDESWENHFSLSKATI